MVRLCEQETVMSMARDEAIWRIWSTDGRMIRKIRRLAEGLSIQVNSGNDGGPWAEVLIPVSMLRISRAGSACAKPKGAPREVALARLKKATELRRSRRAGLGEAASPVVAAGQFSDRDAEELLPVGREAQ